MSKTLLFFFLVNLIFVALGIIGFYTGGTGAAQILFDIFGKPNKGSAIGESAFLYLFGTGIGALVGVLFGLTISLIIIRHLGKRWGKQLNFGSHPVLKLTALGFLTAVVILFIVLMAYGSLGKGN